MEKEYTNLKHYSINIQSFEDVLQIHSEFRFWNDSETKLLEGKRFIQFKNGELITDKVIKLREIHHRGLVPININMPNEIKKNEHLNEKLSNALKSINEFTKSSFVIKELHVKSLLGYTLQSEAILDDINAKICLGFARKEFYSLGFKQSDGSFIQTKIGNDSYLKPILNKLHNGISNHKNFRLKSMFLPNIKNT